MAKHLQIHISVLFFKNIFSVRYLKLDAQEGEELAKTN